MIKQAAWGVLAGAVVAGCAAQTGEPTGDVSGAGDSVVATSAIAIAPSILRCPIGEEAICTPLYSVTGRVTQSCHCVVPPPPACAAGPDRILATVPFSTTIGTHALVTSGMTKLCGGLPEGCSPSTALEFPVTAASAGSTIWENASTANFTTLTALLTNGVNDPFSDFFLAGSGSGHAAFENDFFAGQGPDGFDLTGFAITWIGYRVDSVSFVSPGANPDGDGIWTESQVSGAFLFWGNCAP